MTARILVVDDVKANVKLMQARLMAEYFDVVSAYNGPDALDICRRGLVDVVLLDVMMPGMDGYEVCRSLKADSRTAHIPIVMVSSLDQPSDKVEGLSCGADDFLTKPVNDLALTTRLRSLSRLKMVTDELRLRVSSNNEMGVKEEFTDDHIDPKDGREGRILVVDERQFSFKNLVKPLEREHTVDVVTVPQEALFRAAENEYDLIIVSLALEELDPLRLCSQLRSLDRTRNTPVLVVANEGDDSIVIRAIDLGVNDYISRPLDKSELLARARTQVRRKRLNNRLRDNMQATMELAVRDSLTGMNNRRYFDTHMESLFNQASVGGRPLSLILVDIDHFKAVNDTHGHQTGDDVLRLFAQRLVKSVRSRDLACRYGGEEFMIAMPDTDSELAMVVAERMRREIEGQPLGVRNGEMHVSITMSAGIASIQGPDDTIEQMVARADKALYEAKKSGRNQVQLAA
ncbi:PleD family two-component system response regulator [Pseudahrensia aquimaris]|uniref:diguanylate cyclase n=1 Tax=Pseudahrensia aquimaris TaxID=744461 RepID=A0ABW3FHU3_9HYPH